MQRAAERPAAAGGGGGSPSARGCLSCRGGRIAGTVQGGTPPCRPTPHPPAGGRSGAPFLGPVTNRLSRHLSKANSSVGSPRTPPTRLRAPPDAQKEHLALAVSLSLNYTQGPHCHHIA